MAGVVRDILYLFKRKRNNYLKTKLISTAFSASQKRETYKPLLKEKLKAAIKEEQQNIFNKATNRRGYFHLFINCKSTFYYVKTEVSN